MRGRSAGHNVSVRALLHHGANLNARYSNGKSHLHIAIESRAFKANGNLKYSLLEYGANPNVQDNNGGFPLLQILYGGFEPLEQHRRNASALILNQTNFITDVIIMPPGTLNIPLHLAVRRNDSWAVGMLLAKGAAVDKRNGAGLTPMVMAASGRNDDMTDGQAEIVQLLLEKGADVNERIGSSNHTLLHIALTLGRADLVNLLLDFSAV